MTAHRTSAVIAVLALLAAAVAVAQTPPPASTDPGNTSATSPSSDMTKTPASEGASSSSATQDPKLDQCVSDEKAKNTGLSENQLKQKCMLKIAGDQGKGH
jgi:hypothetical protein